MKAHPMMAASETREWRMLHAAHEKYARGVVWRYLIFLDRRNRDLTLAEKLLASGAIS